jgi:XTP/dITP diphosphohydrolase
MKILFATNNEHKVREINAILPESIELLKPSDAGYYDDIPETGDTLEENALMKARRIFQITGIPSFADDTGLEIESLGGEPGVRSARYAGEDKDMEKNIALVLERLGSTNDRQARFRTVIAFVTAKGEHLFEGTVSGTILREKRGTSGFGYDPVFMPDGSNLTFAEMTGDQKNEISHRSAAFGKLSRFLAITTDIQ